MNLVKFDTDDANESSRVQVLLPRSLPKWIDILSTGTFYGSMCYEQLTLQATEQVEQPQSEREAEQARLVFDVKTSQVDERTKSWPGQKPAETWSQQEKLKNKHNKGQEEPKKCSQVRKLW